MHYRLWYKGMPKTKQQMQEKIDHLPTPNLKDKHTSHIDNHHLNKIQNTICFTHLHILFDKLFLDT